MTEELVEVCVTAPDPEWLADLTRSLVEERLVAGGQIISPLRSVFRWNGAVSDITEARVALHTRRSLVAAVLARVHAVHPYDVPGVIVVPMLDAGPGYATWVTVATTAPPGASAEATA